MPAWGVVVADALAMLPGYAADIDRTAIAFKIPSDQMETREKTDPDSTLPAPAGSYVFHYAVKILYDDAKDGETII